MNTFSWFFFLSFFWSKSVQLACLYLTAPVLDGFSSVIVRPLLLSMLRTAQHTHSRSQPWFLWCTWCLVRLWKAGQLQVPNPLMQKGHVHVVCTNPNSAFWKHLLSHEQQKQPRVLLWPMGATFLYQSWTSVFSKPWSTWKSRGTCIIGSRISPESHSTYTWYHFLCSGLLISHISRPGLAGIGYNSVRKLKFIYLWAAITHSGHFHETSFHAGYNVNTYTVMVGGFSTGKWLTNGRYLHQFHALLAHLGNRKTSPRAGESREFKGSQEGMHAQPSTYFCPQRFSHCIFEAFLLEPPSQRGPSPIATSPTEEQRHWITNLFDELLRQLGHSWPSSFTCTLSLLWGRFTLPINPPETHLWPYILSF